jgi:hypothetical protein
VDERAGIEHPHNNYDLMVVTRGLSGFRQADVKRRAHAAVAPLAVRYDVGMDVGTVSTLELRRSPCLVMWYDMRFGHKTLLGDPSFVPGLTRFSLERIEPHDVRNLLVNRATLLLINELLLESSRLGEAERRTIVKHTVKAIIGYGDALLFFLGDYHWSYVKKRARMRLRSDVSDEFRSLYDEAMEFRFRPRYGRYLDRDLSALNARLLQTLAPIHLRCEALRLDRPALEWESYLEAALPRALGALARRPLRAARSATRVVGAAASILRGPRKGLGAQLSILPERDRLPLFFPAIAYAGSAEGARRVVAGVLGADPDVAGALRNAYLRAWGAHGDVNFVNLLHKLGLAL